MKASREDLGNLGEKSLWQIMKASREDLGTLGEKSLWQIMKASREDLGTLGEKSLWQIMKASREDLGTLGEKSLINPSRLVALMRALVKECRTRHEAGRSGPSCVKLYYKLIKNYAMSMLVLFVGLACRQIM